MKLARFWAWGSAAAQGVSVRCRGWSNESLIDAQQKARKIGETMALRIAAGDMHAAKAGYLYGDRPLPEPEIETLPGGMITRNAYGALVLNTSTLMFLDIDQEDAADAPAALDLFSGLRSLFGKPSAPPPQRSGVSAEMEAVASRHNLGLRIYRTAAGYRGIVTNHQFSPVSDETRRLLAEFRCDPLYIRLCQAQESFRARLTPKPWRCGLNALPVKFPYEDQATLDDWLRRYQANASRNATCQFIRALGPEATDPEFVALIHRHDRETKADSGLPLA